MWSASHQNIHKSGLFSASKFFKILPKTKFRRIFDFSALIPRFIVVVLIYWHTFGTFSSFDLFYVSSQIFLQYCFDYIPYRKKESITESGTSCRVVRVWKCLRTLNWNKRLKNWWNGYFFIFLWKWVGFIYTQNIFYRMCFFTENTKIWFNR